LYLTAKAHAQADTVVGFTDDLRRELYRDIDPAELENALAVIKRLQQNLDRARD
jgi:MarR family transcriptional regulator for hemolysin